MYIYIWVYVCTGWPGCGFFVMIHNELKGAYVIVLTRIIIRLSSLNILGHSSCSRLFWAMTMSTTSWSHRWAMTTSIGFNLSLVSKRAGRTVRGEICFLPSPPKAGLNTRKVKRIGQQVLIYLFCLSQIKSGIVLCFVC